MIVTVILFLPFPSSQWHTWWHLWWLWWWRRKPRYCKSSSWWNWNWNLWKDGQSPISCPKLTICLYFKGYNLRWRDWTATQSFRSRLVRKTIIFCLLIIIKYKPGTVQIPFTKHIYLQKWRPWSKQLFSNPWLFWIFYQRMTRMQKWEQFGF